MDDFRHVSLRQGHFLSDECILAFGAKFSASRYWIVATHDCDIQQGLDNEPYIELYPCDEVDALESYSKAKNPRVLRFEAEFDGAKKY